MKQKTFFLVISITLVVGLIIYLCLPTRLTDENVIKVSENFNLLRNTSDVTTSTVRGKIKETVFSLKTEYTLQMEKKTAAVGRMSMFSWGTEIKYYDEHDAYLGYLKEDVLKSLVSWHSTYYVYDKNDQLIAESKKSELLSTSINLYSPNGDLIAKIHRPNGFLTFGFDEWTITIQKPGVIDDRVLILIAAYKTHADNEKDNKKDKKHRKKD